MKIFLSIILLLLSSIAARSQNIFKLSGKDYDQIKSYAILPDKGYSFQQIVNDRALPFVENGSLNPHKSSIYWIRVKLLSPLQYAEPYQLWMHPQINNTLFYFDVNRQQWIAERAGLTVRQNKRIIGYMPFILQDNAVNVLYIKANVQLLQKFKLAILPGISIKKQGAINQYEQFIKMVWVCTLLIVLAFLLYHTYLFFHFKDKIYLYYIIIQLGGMIYVTSFRNFFNQLFSYRLVRLQLQPNGDLYFYDFNLLMLHIAIIAIMYGFVQLARTYLNTKLQLPKLDKLLVICLTVYVVYTIISGAITISGLFYLDYYTVRSQNILILLLIGMILFIAVKSMRKGISAGKYFLLANIIPLALMLALALYFSIFRFNSTRTDLLPYVAVISQAVAFAIALVWRVNLIKAELNGVQTEMITLQAQNEHLELRNEVIVKENKRIADEMLMQMDKNEALKNKLEANQRELASNTLYIFQKNELMADLRKKVGQLAQQHDIGTHKQTLNVIKSSLQNSLQLDNDWDKFKLHYEQVHPNFFMELEQKYPNLTAYEIRLCTYLHLKMSAKEIASLLNIDANSVHRAKTRLKKKMELY